MRKILLILLAALLGAAACSRSDGEDFDTKEKPRIAVFLTPDATPEQRKAVEDAISAQPGVDTVEYESPEEAYARYKSLTASDPALDIPVRPEQMPASIRFTTTDLAAYNKIRNGSFPDALKKMPGVDDVIIQCATLEECKKTLTPPPTPR